MGKIESDITARLARIKADRHNAFIRIDEDYALAQAHACDDRAAAGEPPRPLEGMAVAVKDNIAVGGKTWTGGINGRRKQIAEVDAGVVSRLSEAGAIILGGLNMEEGALGAVTDNPTFGRCINPLGEGLTPGGSSGGSGAAVAAGLVDMALGSDTMGSVRIPAAYCGTAGLKPTTGLIGRSGFLYLSPTLDTIGPLTKRVSELWPVTQVLAGLDGSDLASCQSPEGWGARHVPQDLSGLSFGVPKQIGEVDYDPAVLQGLKIAADALQDLGADVAECDLAGWDPSTARRGGLILSEVEGAVEMADLLDEPGALSGHLQDLLRYGQNISSTKLASALKDIDAAKGAFNEAMNAFEALILPTAPQRAFPHGTPSPVNQADLTALANFAGAPAVSLPVPLPGEILPASVQLLGAHWSEARLLVWAELLEKRLSNDG